MGIREDASALRKFKNHRDQGEKMLSSIQPGDEDKVAEWARIDNWWADARPLAPRNVFRPFLTLGDINRFEQP
jgi:hypothetical protein